VLSQDAVADVESKDEVLMKILVTDTLADSGLAILRAASDMEVDYRPGLKDEALLKAVSESDALITRSGTAVTEELVNAGDRLRIVGRAGVGLDNVDVDACTARGILVINAPTANIMSATEHTMAMLLALCRNIPEAHASVKRGEWNRSKFLGTELDGKTLGIIGLGRIGTRITKRARAFGMKVIAYDPYVAPKVFDDARAERVSLDELLGRADVITVHTPLTDETRGMIGAAEMAKMKDGVVVLNIARGGIYDEQSLADALNSGKIAGAAIDVYVEEPPKDNPLLSAKNIILSPHIGANTIEAQDRVAVQTSEMVVDALRGSIFVSAVNLPFEGLADADNAPFIDLAERLGLFAAQIISGPITGAAVELWGIDERLTKILRVAGLKGLLTPHLDQSVNFVNAEQVAQQRGIAIESRMHPMPLDYTNLITVRVWSATDETCVSATLFSEKNQRIVSVNNFRVEFKPEGTLLYIINKDVPGVVGKVGTILGDREINIAEYNLARETSGGKALAIVTIDSPLDADTMNALRFFKAIEEVKQVRL
jgi:D-3-phosphoglycerate dehydrogenase